MKVRTTDDRIRFVERFRPRHEPTAKWVLFVLTAVSAGVSMLFTLALPSLHTRNGSAMTIAGGVIMLAVVTALLVMRRPPAWLWAAYPFQAVAVMVLVDLASRDASVTSQVFFIFPVLYAGAQLRRHGAAAICAAAIAGEAAVAFTLTSGAEAATSLVFVAAVLSTAGALLVQAGERNDALIRQLEQQAAVDPLTGLTTRRVLDTAVASALDGAGDTAGTALLLMDVDRFKDINDVHGHPAGDAVLQQLAGILLGVSRRGDLVSRLGGDEIAMLLTGCPQETAVRRAEQILDSVRAHVFDVAAQSMAPHEPKRLAVTLSIGVGHLPTRAGDLRGLYSAADEALYEAKRNGRNQVAALAPALPYPAADALPDRRVARVARAG